MKRSAPLCVILLLAGAHSTASPVESPLAQGERAFQKCNSCHTLEPGKSDDAGPSLYKIIGRRVASEPGFDYSPALEQFARKHPRWTRELVLRFSADPEWLVPGTWMTFHGTPDEKERAALLHYLESVERRPPAGKSRN